MVNKIFTDTTVQKFMSEIDLSIFVLGLIIINITKLSYVLNICTVP